MQSSFKHKEKLAILDVHQRWDTDDPRCFRFPMPRIYRRNERRHRIRMALARKIMARKGWKVEGSLRRRSVNCFLFYCCCSKITNCWLNVIKQMVYCLFLILLFYDVHKV